MAGFATIDVHVDTSALSRSIKAAVASNHGRVLMALSRHAREWVRALTRFTIGSSRGKYGTYPPAPKPRKRRSRK